MFEIELRFKISGQEVPFDRFAEGFKLEIVQAVGGMIKSRSEENWPVKPSASTIDSGPRAHSVAETAIMLSLSKATITRRIREGKLRAIHVGSRVLVPSESIQELLRNGI